MKTLGWRLGLALEPVPVATELVLFHTPTMREAGVGVPCDMTPVPADVSATRLAVTTRNARIPHLHPVESERKSQIRYRRHGAHTSTSGTSLSASNANAALLDSE